MKWTDQKKKKLKKKRLLLHEFGDYFLVQNAHCTLKI